LAVHRVAVYREVVHRVAVHRVAVYRVAVYRMAIQMASTDSKMTIIPLHGKFLAYDEHIDEHISGIRFSHHLYCTFLCTYKLKLLPPHSPSLNLSLF
jgi:hypothetical protein